MYGTLHLPPKPPTLPRKALEPPFNIFPTLSLFPPSYFSTNHTLTLTHSSPFITQGKICLFSKYFILTMSYDSRTFPPEPHLCAVTGMPVAAEHSEEVQPFPLWTSVSVSWAPRASPSCTEALLCAMDAPRRTSSLPLASRAKSLSPRGSFTSSCTQTKGKPARRGKNEQSEATHHSSAGHPLSSPLLPARGPSWDPGQHGQPR